MFAKRTEAIDVQRRTSCLLAVSVTRNHIRRRLGTVGLVEAH